MGAVRVTKTLLKAGVWHGVAVREDGSEGPAPQLSAWHLERALDGPEVVPSKTEGQWEVRLRVPPEILSDGVQTILMRDDESGDTIQNVTLVAGEPLEADIRAEVDLLRAELDMLKRAFRRHCVETGG